MDISRMKINFLGDSITVGAGASDHRFSYVGRFIEKYPEATIRSYCIGGSCISNKCVWGVESMCERIPKMDADADVVVAFGGSNDFECSVPLGTPQDRTEDTFYGACHEMLRKLRQKFPVQPIVVVTPLHRRGENDHRNAERELQAPLGEYARIVSEVANRFDCPIIDLHQLLPEFMTEPHGRGEALTVDGLHPTDEGYALLFEKLDDGLQAL